MRIINLAASKHLAAALIAALAVACLLGGVSDSLFSPWVMAALLGALGINTGACTIRMLPSLRRGSGAEVALEGKAADGAGFALERAREVLASLGYRTQEISFTLVGKRGIPARWALVVFHVALVVLMIGIGVEALLRSERVLVVAQGAFFEDRPEYYAYAQDGAFGSDYGRFYGRALRVWQDKGTDWCSMAILHRGPGGKSRVQFSRAEPATLLGGTLRLRQTGPAPVLVVRKGEETILDACVNVLAGGERGPSYDEVPLAGGRRLRLTPQDDGKAFSVSLLEDGRPVMKGALSSGGNLEAGGWSIEMPEVRRWAEVALVEDRMLIPVLASAGLCVVALGAYAMMYGRSMEVAVRDDGAVLVKGRSDRFNPLFREELTGVLEDVTKGRAS